MVVLEGGAVSYQLDRDLHVPFLLRRCALEEGGESAERERFSDLIEKGLKFGNPLLRLPVYQKRFDGERDRETERERERERECVREREGAHLGLGLCLLGLLISLLTALQRLAGLCKSCQAGIAVRNRQL